MRSINGYGRIIFKHSKKWWRPSVLYIFTLFYHIQHGNGDILWIVTGSSPIFLATTKRRPWKFLISFLDTWWKSSLYSLSTPSIYIWLQLTHCPQTKSNTFEKVVIITWVIIFKHNQDYKWTYFSFYNYHLPIFTKSYLTYLSLQNYGRC